MSLKIKHRTIAGVRHLPGTGFGVPSRLLLASMATVILVVSIITAPTTQVLALATPKKVYRYFGYGSNVVPSTMKALRQIEVREVTAAVLPDYELKFASAAFVRPVLAANSTANDIDADGEEEDSLEERSKLPASDRVVHGLLYTLTEDEFARVGQTEGVPIGYRWQSCNVYPYAGDGKRAGMDCLNDSETLPVQAYTLVEPTPASSQQKQQQQQRKNREKGGIPPSASYLGLIREGARLWKFDRKYQDELATIQTATSKNLLFPDGLEGPALELAEKATGTKRTYMIDGY
jgi:hypothetical protein